jgi:uncharacterized protein (DUF2141 family)
MKTTIILIVILALIFPKAIISQTNNLKSLKISITNVRNANGEININIYNMEEGFPKEESKAYRHLRGTIKGGTCTINLGNLPYGTYAIAIYHDENSNHKIDKNWYGIPSEGIAVSNNAKGSISGPPSFDAAKFNFNAENSSISITMNYSFTK